MADETTPAVRPLIKKDSPKDRDERVFAILSANIDNLKTDELTQKISIHQIEKAMEKNRNNKNLIDQLNQRQAQLKSTQFSLDYYIQLYNNGSFNFLDEK